MGTLPDENERRKKTDTDARPEKRRRYDSPLRKQRAAETRERIIAAGADLLRGFPIWNWQALTVRAVARRAGVNERTVYRHFANERELREAVFARQGEEAGIDLGELSLDNVEQFTKNIFEHVSIFPIEPRAILDPTLRKASMRSRELLLEAVNGATDGWTRDDQKLAAAMLDVLWSVASYERLVTDWELTPSEATRGVVWVMKLVKQGIEQGRGPSS